MPSVSNNYHIKFSQYIIKLVLTRYFVTFIIEYPNEKMIGFLYLLLVEVVIYFIRDLPSNKQPISNRLNIDTLNLGYVADIDFHLKFRFLIFFYWSRVTDSLVISFNVEHRCVHHHHLQLPVGCFYNNS
ncbi:hypothetical protein T07_4068 [Trichinella nelsoni]|uniref:Uncharacterized protein n=1 Tax=Trichinella nelsoni TaxID=6336 RepID=A0A0V0SLE3_9BILA|nr:hypothetical protein T07_4068 [Trichinella nelsoni]